MAHTRPWTRAEERIVQACDRATLHQVARQLQRSVGSVLDRWYRHHRNAIRPQKYPQGLHGLLPDGVTVRDPHGTYCMKCGDDRSFGTIDGVCFAECRCGRQLVERRRP